MPVPGSRHACQSLLQPDGHRIFLPRLNEQQLLIMLGAGCINGDVHIARLPDIICLVCKLSISIGRHLHRHDAVGKQQPHLNVVKIFLVSGRPCDLLCFPFTERIRDFSPLDVYPAGLHPLGHSLKELYSPFKAHQGCKKLGGLNRLSWVCLFSLLHYVGKIYYLSFRHDFLQPEPLAARL